MEGNKVSSTLDKNLLFMENKSADDGHSLMRQNLMVLLLVCFGFLIYSNTLRGPFTFDDVRNIQNNPHIRLTRLWPADLMRAAIRSPIPSRPVANISFALNYYFHRYDVLGYHLVNIIIHITTGILLYFFSRTTLAMPSLRSNYANCKWIPFFTASVWLVHPIHTQSVSYIVQRMNSMAAMFYILSILSYARARLAVGKNKKLMLFAVCTFSGILGFGSKEIAASLPFFIFLYEWYFFRDLSRAWLKRHFRSFAAIVVLLCVMAYIYVGAGPAGGLLSDYDKLEFTLKQRVLTEFRVVTYYINLLMFPHYSRFHLDYDFPLSYSLFEPMSTLLSMMGIAGLAFLSFYLAKKERLISFCILWFLGNLAIESSVIPLELIYEYRTYLPSMLLSLMMVTLIYRCINKKWVVVPALIAVMAVGAGWTYKRNHAWSDEIILWSDNVTKSPLKARPRNQLGLALARQGRFDEAIEHYGEALRIEPDYVDAHNNLGAALAAQDRFEEAIKHYSKALAIKPDFAPAHSNLAGMLVAKGRFEEAVDHCSYALKINPHHAKMHCTLATAFAGLGRFEDAVRHFSEAVRIRPDFAKAHNDLGLVLKKVGRLEESVHHLSKATQIDANFAEARLNLGITLAEQGNVEKAMYHFSKAVENRPDSADAHYNLGLALAIQGRRKEAMYHLSEVLEIRPDSADAHFNLGALLAGQGGLEEAIHHFSEALRIKPDFVQAKHYLRRALEETGKASSAPKKSTDR